MSMMCMQCVICEILAAWPLWPAALIHFERKTDWVMTFYKGYKTHDGVENWPAMEVDFARMQLENPSWWQVVSRDNMATWNKRIYTYIHIYIT